METNIKQRIQRITGISDDDYSLLVYDLGLAYAKHHTFDDDMGVHYITGSKVYWMWYQNNWDIIDRKFLSFYEDAALLNPNQKELYRKLYSTLHEPEQMTAYPGEYILDTGYAEMVGKMIDQSFNNETK